MDKAEWTILKWDSTLSTSELFTNHFTQTSYFLTSARESEPLQSRLRLLPPLGGMSSLTWIGVPFGPDSTPCGLAQKFRAVPLKSDFLGCIPAQPLTSCVTLGNLLNLSVPLF